MARATNSRSGSKLQAPSSASAFCRKQGRHQVLVAAKPLLGHGGFFDKPQNLRDSFGPFARIFGIGASLESAGAISRLLQARRQLGSYFAIWGRRSWRVGQHVREHPAASATPRKMDMFLGDRGTNAFAPSETERVSPSLEYLPGLALKATFNRRSQIQFSCDQCQREPVFRVAFAESGARRPAAKKKRNPPPGKL